MILFVLVVVGVGSVFVPPPCVWQELVESGSWPLVWLGRVLQVLEEIDLFLVKVACWCTKLLLLLLVYKLLTL